MKSVLRKSFFLLLFFLLVALPLFSGGTQEESETSGTTDTTKAKLSVNTLPIVEPGSFTLVYAGRDTIWHDTSYNDGLAVWKEVERRTGINIKWEVFPANQADVNLKTRLAAGRNLPDLIQLPGAIGDVVKYANDGLILPLSGLIESYAPNIVKFFEEYPVIRKSLIAPDGEIYFLGNYKLGPPNARSFVVRNDWLIKLGMDVPETIDDWYVVLKAFKENDLNGNGAGDVIPYMGDITFFRSGFGLVSSAMNNYYWYDESGQIYFYVMDENYRDFLTFAKKLYDEQLLDPMYGMANSPTQSFVDHNRVAVQITWGASPATLDARLTGLGFKGVDHKYILPPKDENGQRVFEVVNPAANSLRWAITKDCRNVEAVIRFLDYIYASQEGTRLIICGFEGEEYDIIDGKLTFREEMFTNPNYSYSVLLKLRGAFESLMDCQTDEFNRARMRGKFKSNLELIEQSGEGESFPLIIPTIEEQEKIVNLGVDIFSYIDEMTVNFVTGRRSLSEYDKFIEELRKMHIDELRDVYQTQYNRYLEL